MQVPLWGIYGECIGIAIGVHSPTVPKVPKSSGSESLGLVGLLSPFENISTRDPCGTRKGTYLKP